MAEGGEAGSDPITIITITIIGIVIIIIITTITITISISIFINNSSNSNNKDGRPQRSYPRLGHLGPPAAVRGRERRGRTAGSAGESGAPPPPPREAPHGVPLLRQGAQGGPRGEPIREVLG